MEKDSKQRLDSNSVGKIFEFLFYKTHLEIHRHLPVTMYKFGGFVHAPMNCTTFLCLTFLQVPMSLSEHKQRQLKRDLFRTVFIEEKNKKITGVSKNN